jgi:hypothetical protein
VSGIGSKLRMLVTAALPLVLFAPAALAQAGQVNTIRETIERFQRCWRPPPLSRANPMDITVIVSFNRSGEILGRPRISYESAGATDNDRLQYRIAVMEALQRCTPVPFTESMAGAAAGHPFWIRFHSAAPQPAPQPAEKRAWLTPRIL